MFKRKSDAEDDGSRKAPKLGGAGGSGGGKMSFAAKMMAKMGYKEGEGLGRSGDGILKAIEVKQRPQGVGLGAVREKTEQDKQEAKRQALKRGEEYEDSSEEERKARRKRKEAVRSATASGASTPGGARKPKTKYRTAAEIERQAEGLEVPNVLKSLIDATGKEAKLITSTAGLMTPTFTSAVEETEAQKIANRARKELESYADAWTELTERNKFALAEEEQVRQELAEQDEEIKQVEQMLQAVQALQDLDLSRPRLADDAANAWEQVTSKLETLQVEYATEVERFHLTEVAVAAINPLFKQEMIDWEPLEKPTHLVPYLLRIKRILGIKKDERALAIHNGRDGFQSIRRQKSTTPYESLIYNSWLPKVRTAITNEWDPLNPSPLITLVESWRDLLPEFIYHNLVDHLVVSKLSIAIQEWNPRTSLKRKHGTPLPHIWLFPWLQFLSPHHTDPTSATGLLTEVKRKIRVVLDTWDLSRGVLPGLDAWSSVLGSTLQDALVKHLLPRLAKLLATSFEVYPPDQDLTPLEHVLVWEKFFKPAVMGQLLIAEFFPKWINTLHAWLTMPEANYEEIGKWYNWWKEQIPASVNAVKAVSDKWEEGLVMMNQAIDLGDDAISQLPPPAAGPSKPIASALRSKEVETPVKARTQAQEVEATFKDVVEEWCEQEGLMLIPLREAHDITGLPLFRITASASGKGGVVVYLKGDVVWARKKNDKTAFEPVGLEQTLIDRAEGK
ncbi:uncharacterized protein PV09_06541 [Verruconis gallopava]|uniref:G-patch domain-containing protein n=1 Tax=Verruconis gallopava TaxID=253628 RepID=A0A0D2ASA7_9PEZI|nr:uncharacterized protein PV09_06541 [Verruconis gallopava]KIW02039.1 hypothetical protein PV09_06541 [Verruconis gallopava]